MADAHDLAPKIEAHAEALARIGRAVEDLTSQIEIATNEARSTLETYHERKAEASATLAEASEQYTQAHRLFARVGDIERELTGARAEHVRLCRMVTSQDADAIEKLKAARATFRDLAGRVERLHRDAGESM